jgi:S-adenosylmethionine:diacylglycerol 3-amino-3-carboxypropyl transferase
MGRFLQHLDAIIFRLREPVDVPISYYWQRCVPLLLDLYGRNGEKASFDMSRSGTDGGLYAVLRAVASKVAEQYAARDVSTRVLNYWNSLNVEEQLASATEYLNKYGHLLPAEVTEGSAARIRANFHRVLEEHPQILRRLRRVGR